MIAGGVQRQQAEQAAGHPPQPRPVLLRRGRPGEAEMRQDRFRRGVPQPFQRLAKHVLGTVVLLTEARLDERFKRAVERLIRAVTAPSARPGSGSAVIPSAVTISASLRASLTLSTTTGPRAA